MARSHTTQRPEEWLCQAVGGVIALLGGLTVIGWHLRLPQLIQPLADQAPMQYSAGLSLLSCGLALICLFRRHHHLTRFFALATLLLGTASDLYYLLGNPWQDYQPLIALFDAPRALLAPMSPTSAFCFTLAALALLLATLHDARAHLATTVISGGLVGMALITFMGYLTQLTPALTWGTGIAISLQSAIGLLLLSGGLLFHSLGQARQRQGARQWLIASSVALILTLSISLQLALSMERQRALEKILNANANILAAEIASQLNELAVAMARMGRRWETSGGTSQPHWHADAMQYYQDYKVLQALEWVDADMTLRWVVPSEKYADWQGTSLSQSPARQPSLIAARPAGPYYSHRTELGTMGDTVFLINPLYPANKFDGWLVGLLDMNQQLATVNPLIEEFGIFAQLLEADGTPLTPGNNHIQNNELLTSKAISVPGQSWQLQVAPTQHFYRIHATPLHSIISSLTFVMFLPLFWLLHQFMKVRDHERHISRLHGRLDGAFNTMLDGLVIISDNGIIEDVNNTTLRIFNFQREDLVGKNVSVLMPFPHRDQHDEFLRAYHGPDNSTIIGKTRVLRAQRQNGEEFPIELKVSEGEDRGQRFFTGVIRDLTDKLATEEKLESVDALLKTAIHAANIGVVISDTDGYIVDVNQSLCDWLGYQREELLGNHARILIPEHERSEVRSRVEAMLAGDIPPQRNERRFRRKDGSEVVGLASATGVKDKQNKVSFMVAHILDTEPERKLRDALEERNEALESINAELDQFAYVASHDLKEPLRTLRTFSSYLIKDVEANNQDRIAQDIEFIDNAASRMNQLIDDLLQLSRASNKAFEFQSIDADVCVHAAQEQLGSLIDDTEATIQMADDLPVVFGDPTQLTRVFLNLISNAIKFHRPQVPPVVTIRQAVNHSPGYATIVVEDNGIGIDPQYIDDIFAAFRKLHSSARYAGTGIGLAIVKKIVDRHSGDITVTSTPGQGTQFTLALPTTNPGTHHEN